MPNPSPARRQHPVSGPRPTNAPPRPGPHGGTATLDRRSCTPAVRGRAAATRPWGAPSTQKAGAAAMRPVIHRPGAAPGDGMSPIPVARRHLPHASPKLAKRVNGTVAQPGRGAAVPRIASLADFPRTMPCRPIGCIGRAAVQRVTPIPSRPICHQTFRPRLTPDSPARTRRISARRATSPRTRGGAFARSAGRAAWA